MLNSENLIKKNKQYTIQFENNTYIIPVEKNKEGKSQLLTGVQLKSLFWEQLAEKIKAEGNKQELHPQGAFQLYVNGHFLSKKSIKEEIQLTKNKIPTLLEMKLYKVNIVYLINNKKTIDTFSVVISLKEDFNMLKQKIQKHFYLTRNEDFQPNRQLLYKKISSKSKLNKQEIEYEEMIYKSSFEQYNIQSGDLILLKHTKKPPQYQYVGISGILFIIQILGSLVYIGTKIYTHQVSDTYFDPIDGETRVRTPQDPLIPSDNPLDPNYSVGLLALRLWGQMFGDTFASLLFWWLQEFLDIFGIVIFILMLFTIIQVILCGLGMKERNLVKCFVIFFTVSFLVAQTLQFYLKFNQESILNCKIYRDYVDGLLPRVLADVKEGKPIYKDPEGILQGGYKYLQELVCDSSLLTFIYEFIFGALALAVYWYAYQSIKIHSKVEQNSNYLSIPLDTIQDMKFDVQFIEDIEQSTVKMINTDKSQVEGGTNLDTSYNKPLTQNQYDY